MSKYRLPERGLITGATSGIGRATAELFALLGVEIGVLSGNPVKVEETVAHLRQSGGSAFPVVADLSRREASERLIDRIEAERGPLDLLINNAGIGLQADIHNLVEEDVRQLFEVNFFSMAFLSRDALRNMAERGHGTIVNVSSAAARRALPGLSIYASSKAAMHAFSQALRLEGKPVGVHVIEVLPMSVHTPFFAKALNRTERPYRVGELHSSPEAVARRILQAVRHPAPEVYTSSLARMALGIDGLNPRWLDLLLSLDWSWLERWSPSNHETV